VTTKRPSKRSASTPAPPPAGKPRSRASTGRARRAQRPLVTAPPEKCFWVHYGPVLKDLRELRDALAGQISDAQFAYHVESGGNDFANWVEAVLEEPACARALRLKRSMREALRAVEATLRGR
jgi:hypothetical protein